MVCFKKCLICCLYACIFFLGRYKSRICKIFSCWDRNPVYRVYHQITDDPGQGRAPGSPVHSKATSGTVATDRLWMTEDKIGQPLTLSFHQKQVPKTLKYHLRGTFLTVLPWEQRTNFSVLELLPSHCQHFQFHLPLTKCSFLFLRKEAERAFWRPHRQSQKASWAANNSEQTTIWWVKCKRIRDIWITFLGKYTWVCNVKQGHGGGEWRRECLEKCGLGLANCKMFETNNLRCFAQPRVWLDSPFLLFMCHF